MMRCRTITRAAGASLIATIVALLVWVFISAVDQYYGGPLVAMMTGWFGMQSIIVEETSLNIIAVRAASLWPLSSTPLPSSSPPFSRSAGCRGTSTDGCRRRIQGRRFDTPAAFFRLLLILVKSGIHGDKPLHGPPIHCSIEDLYCTSLRSNAEARPGVSTRSGGGSGAGFDGINPACNWSCCH